MSALTSVVLPPPQDLPFLLSGWASAASQLRSGEVHLGRAPGAGHPQSCRTGGCRRCPCAPQSWTGRRRGALGWVSMFQGFASTCGSKVGQPRSRDDAGRLRVLRRPCSVVDQQCVLAPRCRRPAAQPRGPRPPACRRRWPAQVSKLREDCVEGAYVPSIWHSNSVALDKEI